jgi:putative aldouronate transport system permease protein
MDETNQLTGLPRQAESPTRGWLMRKRTVRKMLMDRWLYFMLTPGIIYFLVFKYAPMWGIVIAFQDYSPYQGITGSPWVGIKHFVRLFGDPTFLMLLKNTLSLSLMNLLLVFPMPIVAALMLNELRQDRFKRVVQTLIYIPHFMSWVIIIGIFFVIFEMQDGLFQSLLAAVGLEKFTIMMNPDLFRPVYILQAIWRDTGWGTIIYLAALAGVDQQLYEAARIDGANRFKQLWHVTLPCIRSTIFILLILRLGDILELGFDHVFLMLNSLNREVAEIFDTYVYTMGIIQGSFSYSAAVGLFKSLVGLVLVLVANHLSKKFGEEGII